MDISRRAARLCFASLLIGAGAAAIAAKPVLNSGAMVEVVPGDPRLDLRWALQQSGMSAEEAQRVSVILVDQVDPAGENQAFSVLWNAEVWWRDERASDAAPLRMMRVLLPHQCGSTLETVAKAQADCPSRSRRYFAMRVATDQLPPIARGTAVLVRLLDFGLVGADSSVDCNDFIALAGAGSDVSMASCLDVVVDPEAGVDVPSAWIPGR